MYPRLALTNNRLVPIRVCWSSNTAVSTSKVVGFVVCTPCQVCAAPWPQASRPTNWATSPAPREFFKDTFYLEVILTLWKSCKDTQTQRIAANPSLSCYYRIRHRTFFLLKLWSKSVKWDSLMIQSSVFFLKVSLAFIQGEGESGNLCSKSFSIGNKLTNSVGIAWWLVRNATSCGKKLVYVYNNIYDDKVVLQKPSTLCFKNWLLVAKNHQRMICYLGGELITVLN